MLWNNAADVRIGVGAVRSPFWSDAGSSMVRNYNLWGVLRDSGVYVVSSARGDSRTTDIMMQE